MADTLTLAPVICIVCRYRLDADERCECRIFEED